MSAPPSHAEPRLSFPPDPDSRQEAIALMPDPKTETTPAVEIALSEKRSYRQILKSTSIMGGTSVVTIVLRIIRTKFLAVILGPAGIGLIGTYESICNMINTATSFGVSSSGVRQIAEAYGTDDQERIARTVLTLRRTVLFSGLAGFLSLLFLSRTVSRITFGNESHASVLAVLGLTILFNEISGGQAALINGVRRIRDLAVLNILGAFLGTAISIPIVYFFGERGIVLFMIVVAASSIATSWWYSRKIRTVQISLTWRETLQEAKPLLRLGFAFMSSGLMTMGTLYLLRVLIIRSIGLDGAGIYQAAAGLSVLYTSFILEAMGRDYYPRLTQAAARDEECSSLINKQMEVGVLLAVPGILGTMTFAPFVISLFYSSKFLLAVAILKWQILGILLRVIIWPVSYLFLAKGSGKMFFWTELFANAVHLGLVWLGMHWFGLAGTGMAFFGMYVLYGGLIYAVVQRFYRFDLSPRNGRILVLSIAATAFVFLTPLLMPEMLALAVNAVVTLISGVYAIQAVVKAAGWETMPAALARIREYFQRARR